ncbi:MAG: hypothetical protein PHC66_05145 [Candidatus Nanoarchaeia archaeon]|nr:hypothetical protein [Candidatus Nanoarchaeia archaeon]MDD5239072.1 hypothetical protein [Candidatus Nanoarchaeia archaeon]
MNGDKMDYRLPNRYVKATDHNKELEVNMDAERILKIWCSGCSKNKKCDYMPTLVSMIGVTEVDKADEENLMETITFIYRPDMDSSRAPFCKNADEKSIVRFEEASERLRKEIELKENYKRSQKDKYLGLEIKIIGDTVNDE